MQFSNKNKKSSRKYLMFQRKKGRLVLCPDIIIISFYFIDHPVELRNI